MKRGKMISLKREEKGMTVSELAKELNVSEWRVERWEEGELPDSEHLLNLSAVLDIPVEELLRDGDDEEDGAKDLSYGEGYGINGAGMNVSPKVGEPDNYNKGVLKKAENDISTLKETVVATPSGRDGYGIAERVFGYIVMAIFICIVIVTESMQFIDWINRPRELTTENYGDYITVSVDPVRNYNCDEYIVTIEAKEDITDLNMFLEIDFYLYMKGNVEQTVQFSGSIKKGEKLEKRVYLEIFGTYTRYRVRSISGGLA